MKDDKSIPTDEGTLNSYIHPSERTFEHEKTNLGLLLGSIAVVVIVLLSTGVYVSLKNQSEIQPATITEQTDLVDETELIDTSNWQTYRNEELGFEFQYPDKLKVIEEPATVTLTHSIEYENSGDCDMGPFQYSKTLEDFNVSFELVEGQLALPYVDGDYQSGNLKGQYAYVGAEGCGHSGYLFPIGEKKTLVVQRASVQALSGLTNNWQLDEILNVPGVITREEERRIFDQILSTFKIIKPETSINIAEFKLIEKTPVEPEQYYEVGNDLVKSTDTSNWKIHRNSKYGFEIKYPPELILNIEEGENGGDDMFFIGKKGDNGEKEEVFGIFPFSSWEVDPYELQDLYVNAWEESDEGVISVNTLTINDNKVVYITIDPEVSGEVPYVAYLVTKGGEMFQLASSGSPPYPSLSDFLAFIFSFRSL